MALGGNNPYVLQGIAGAAIGAFCFVQYDPGSGNKQQVLQGTANCRTCGIGPDYSTLSGVAIPFASGGVGQVTLGATVVAGDRLKSDASGHAVPIDTGGTKNQNVGAIAVESGVSGDVIFAQVVNDNVQPGDYLS